MLSGLNILTKGIFASKNNKDISQVQSYASKGVRVG